MSEIKERPILFSRFMVRAILAGTKTQTRRVINPQPEKKLEHLTGEWFTHYWQSGGMWNDAGKVAKCPYGKVGDRLWVRETWLKDGEVYLYKADFGKGVISSSWEGYWKPSIHMPKVACRIFLEIVNVRVERVQDISEEDACAEGVDHIPSAPAALSHRTSFSSLWDQINKERGFGWDVNPWVWVLDFKGVER